MKRGFFSTFLHVFKREAGTPSASAAEEILNSRPASSISDSVNSMSLRIGSSPSEGAKKSMGFSTIHSGLALTNTDLYCSERTEEAKSGSGLGLPVAGSMNGPILAHVFCLDLAKL